MRAQKEQGQRAGARMTPYHRVDIVNKYVLDPKVFGYQRRQIFGVLYAVAVGDIYRLFRGIYGRFGHLGIQCFDRFFAAYYLRFRYQPPLVVYMQYRLYA